MMVAVKRFLVWSDSISQDFHPCRLHNRGAPLLGTLFPRSLSHESIVRLQVFAVLHHARFVHLANFAKPPQDSANQRVAGIPPGAVSFLVKDEPDILYAPTLLRACGNASF